MSRFDELMNAIRNPGDDGVPDTIYDDLTAEYNTAFEGYTENSREKDETIAHLNGEVSRLKSANYDLLTKVQTGSPIDSSDVGDNGDDEVPTIESLFKRK